MKTHLVIDLVYHEDEGNEVFEGTHQECIEWASNQGFGYQVVPKTKEQLDHDAKYFISVDPAMGDDHSVTFKKHSDGRVEVLTSPPDPDDNVD